MLQIYRIMTTLLGPFLNVYLRRRRSRGKEDPDRFGERQGFPTRPRPPGPLVWAHAASVGEAMSALALIERLLERNPEASLLLTTGTVTSARLMAKRLPPRAFHQYIPVDRLPAIRSFLKHWHPDLVLWIESEFWPNLISETRRLGAPMLLLNARISETSYRRWLKYPGLIQPMLQAFDLCLAQSLPDAGRLGTLGAVTVTCRGNLKNTATPLPAEPRDLERLNRTLRNRPCWLAASTHEGEERLVGRVHTALRRRFSDLVTIIVPRHPERGLEITNTLRARGLRVSRRSGMEPIDVHTEVYVADTMGELGLFYRLAPIAFIGGSLIPHGGQNPLEAARLGCAILFGPHMDNFAESAAALTKANTAAAVADARGLEAELVQLLANPALAAARANAGLEFTAQGQEVLAAILDEIQTYLGPQFVHAHA